MREKIKRWEVVAGKAGKTLSKGRGSTPKRRGGNKPTGKQKDKGSHKGKRKYGSVWKRRPGQEPARKELEKSLTNQ